MDVDAYLARIGLTVRPTADVAGLQAIQRAQRHNIPFENLDIPLGRGICLEPDVIFDKLVTRKRGGYCFEQNALLCAALVALGFESRPLLGRVWLFAKDFVPPRTHTLNLVHIDGEDWIADAGFSASHAPPLRVRDGEACIAGDGVAHRMTRQSEHGWMTEREAGKGFKAQYSFTLDPAHPLDLAMSNHWTSTWHGSRFTQNVIASLVLPSGMLSLMNRIYVREEGEERTERDIESASELQSCLSRDFGIQLSEAEVCALGLFEK